MQSQPAKHLLQPVLLITFTLVLAGCVLPDYKARNKAGISPAQPLNFAACQGSLEATVHTVIVHDGPGAWKQETWWDEYVVRLTNHGDEAIQVETAELLDFEAQASAPGDEPWGLERRSQQWWQKNSARNTGYALALGVGAYGVAGVAFFGGVAASGTLAGGAAAATVVLAAVPVAVVGTVMVNSHHKQAITAEFQRRRLVLPTTVAAGASVDGSLFFRISPGPLRLVISYHAGNEPRQQLAVELTPLAALHFKKRTSFATPPPTATSVSPPEKK